MRNNLYDHLEKMSAEISESVTLFDKLLLETLNNQKPYITNSEIKLYQSGKKLRPLILMLCAHLSDPSAKTLPIKVIKAAVSLEMLHVATLIHDDIVDDAAIRRGVESLQKSRGVQMAVLMGDLQFVQAVQCFAEEIETDEDLALIRHILDVGNNLCKGEIDELHVNYKLNHEELSLRYYQIADRKTGRLFRLACQTGSILQNGRTTETVHLGEFGSRFGLAFQIMDDINDISKGSEETGKVLGIDILQRRLSLPIIEALNTLPKDSALHQIYEGKLAPKDGLKSACQLILESNSFMKTYSIARNKMLEGISHLEYLPDNRFRQALIDLSYALIN